MSSQEPKILVKTGTIAPDLLGTGVVKAEIVIAPDVLRGIEGNVSMDAARFELMQSFQKILGEPVEVVVDYGPLDTDSPGMVFVPFQNKV